MAKIIFFGTPDYVVCIPQALRDAGYEIVAVVTQPARPSGRDKVVTESPVAQWAKQNSVQVLVQDPIELISDLRKLKPDFAVVASYGKIIPVEILNLFPKGMLNIHPSLLPKYRGACPIQNAILDGIEESGVTIIKMDEKMDHGPIVEQKVIGISDSDSFESLLKSAFQLGTEMLIKILPDYLDGNIKLVVQNEDDATYTWKTNETREAAYFDLEFPPTIDELDRMARAFYPWPCAWTLWERKTTSDKKIVKLLPDKMIQIEGKKPVSFKEFKRGYPDFPLKLE